MLLAFSVLIVAKMQCRQEECTEETARKPFWCAVIFFSALVAGEIPTLTTKLKIKNIISATDARCSSGQTEKGRFCHSQFWKQGTGRAFSLTFCVPCGMQEDLASLSPFHFSCSAWSVCSVMQNQWIGNASWNLTIIASSLSFSGIYFLLYAVQLSFAHTLRSEVNDSKNTSSVLASCWWVRLADAGSELVCLCTILLFALSPSAVQTVMCRFAVVLSRPFQASQVHVAEVNEKKLGLNDWQTLPSCRIVLAHCQYC